VWEWTLDSYHAYVSPCIDCAYIDPDLYDQALHGGGYWASTYWLRPSSRYEDDPTDRPDEVGFRCARTP